VLAEMEFPYFDKGKYWRFARKKTDDIESKGKNDESD